jgi:hypothetical protein
VDPNPGGPKTCGSGGSGFGSESATLLLKPSALKRDHPALPKMKFITFFLCLWVIFALLDPDPDKGTPLNPDPDPQN